MKLKAGMKLRVIRDFRPQMRKGTIAYVKYYMDSEKLIITHSPTSENGWWAHRIFSFWDYFEIVSENNYIAYNHKNKLVKK